jgi:hypothetical protein
MRDEQVASVGYDAKDKLKETSRVEEVGAALMRKTFAVAGGRGKSLS